MDFIYLVERRFTVRWSMET